MSIAWIEFVTKIFCIIFLSVILCIFKKNVDIDELQKMDKVLDNTTVKKVMLWLLSDYCSLHIVDFKDAAKLEKLGIKRKVFLPSPNKEKR